MRLGAAGIAEACRGSGGRAGRPSSDTAEASGAVAQTRAKAARPAPTCEQGVCSRYTPGAPLAEAARRNPCSPESSSLILPSLTGQRRVGHGQRTDRVDHRRRHHRPRARAAVLQDRPPRRRRVSPPASSSCEETLTVDELRRFDEVHFGKFASYYLRREFFFDVHPPLCVLLSGCPRIAELTPRYAHRAKLLLAFSGWVIGYDGHFEFENIGDSYIENKVPYVGLRVLPALFGSAIPAVVYGIMRESGYPRLIGILSASLVLIGQSGSSGCVGRGAHPARTSRQRPHRTDAPHPPRRASRLLHGRLVLHLHSLLQAPIQVRRTFQIARKLEQGR